MKRERQKSSLWFVLVVIGFWGLSGCEDSARNPAQIRPPQIAPQPVLEVISPLPLDTRQGGYLPELMTGVPDGVELLLASSQASIEAVELDYRAGNVDKAREELGQAVDQLQISGYNAQNDPQLTPVYHLLVESAQAKEKVAVTDAAPTDDASQAQQSTPAPIDEIADMPVPETDTPDPKLLGSAEGEVQAISHDLPLTVNDRVLMYLRYFQTPRGSAIVETGLRRAGRYRDMVQRVLREEGMPEDLIYLAQAESAFQPQAVSKAGARGMWQFMAYSGRKYGLGKNWWVDERQDPVQATRAAARYLRALYDEFGDWYLAMAAYNSGAGTIERAVERTGYADFWELFHRNVLPKETQNYVPIILALTLISKDPARYGIEPQPEPAFQADAIQPGHPVDLRLVAETIDTDLDTLRSLNPQLLRLATPADPNFVLRLPAGTGDRFSAEMGAIPPEKWVSWRRHKVEEGETLNAIAKRYRVTPGAITEANNLEASASLELGQKLIIPAAAPSDATADKMVRYRVRHTGSIASIADEFDVTTAELRKWNHLRSDYVARGMRLRIYSGGMTPLLAKAQESPSAAPARRRNRVNHSSTDARSTSVVHHVKPGETLWSIARAYQTTAEAIRSTNKYLFSRPLEVGDSLTILSPR
jgi:membrane-bound lytic murein transglycosylase D